MYGKRVLPIMMCALVAAGVCAAGCSGQQTVSPLAVGDDIRILDGIEADYDNIIFDDFSGGVDYDLWYIGKQAWGTSGDGNGGVVPKNVNYTDDGILVLSGNGEYYTSGEIRGVGSRKNGTLTGAALISKFVTGPGRYQAKMKILPRLGACNAMWTYAYDAVTGGNHEIDIELPGGTRSGVISYENVLNTNYITVEANQSQDVKIAEATKGNTTVLNDGQWHTFGFDWYTRESGEDVTLSNLGGDTSYGKVVYYLDGKVTAISDMFVPYFQSRLWLGVWFPNNSGFVGAAQFESDNMFVDWFSYTPFKDQPVVKFDPTVGASQVAAREEYPTSPVSTATANKIANGDFEYAAQNPSANSGWEYSKRQITAEERKTLTAEEIEAIRLTDVNLMCSVQNGIGVTDSCGAKVEKIGIISQNIDSVYEGINLNFSFRAKGKGSIVINWLDNGGLPVADETYIEANSVDWVALQKSIVSPKGTRRVEIMFISGLDTALYFDDCRLEVM